MQFKDIPIQKKLMRVIFFISGMVLLATCIIFFAYEFYTFRQSSIEKLSTIGKIISTNSTAALAFDNQEDGREILAALKAEPHIVAASLYDKEGNLFAHYPDSTGTHAFPAKPEAEGVRFGSHLEVFESVKQDDRPLGSLYLKSDLDAMYDGFKLYGVTTIVAVAISFLLAYALSKILQKSISKPILALAETVKIVSNQKDYSVRAVHQGKDELGFLTDAFNQMLIQIQDQNQALKEFNQKLEQKVVERTVQLQKSTELFSNLFDYNPASIVISRLDDAKIINVNEAFISSFGFSSKEEVLGKTARELNIVAQPEQREELTQLLKKNKVVKDFEIQSYTKEGKAFWISTSILIIDIENTRCLFSISIDISNRKKAEEQLQAVNKELESFSYSVSHDLRAPLRAVNGYAQMLNEEYSSKLDDEGKRILEVIKYNATKMGALIDDLLAFSRLGRKEIQKTSIHMDRLVDEVLMELQKSMPHSAEIKLGQIHNVMADPGLLRQVLFNLVSNAVKYSSKKKNPVVEISSEQKNGEIIFSVKDNGAGFDMRYAGKLFGVFQRLHSQQEFEGTGVGLAIIKRIILKHGGKVWAEGKVNEGATFNFSLTN